MQISQPESIPAREANLGDCFLSRQCSVRLVGLFRRLEDNRVTDYVFKFRAITASALDRKYEAVFSFAPDDRMARILSVSESLEAWPREAQ